jgi:arsenate reductase
MVRIYHNPRCTKSRQTLALLQENGVEPEVVEYLKTPPSEAEIRDLLAKLGVGAFDLMRRGEKVFKELGLSKDSGDDAMVAAMAEHPILIERPIVVKGGKAAIGRPPETVLNIL